MRANSDPTKAELDPEERARLRAFWDFYDSHRAAVSQEVVAALRRSPESEVMIAAVSVEQRPDQQRYIREAQRLGLEDGIWEPFIEDIRETGARYAQLGARFGAWFPALSSFRDAVRKQLRAERSDHRLDPTIEAGMALYLDFSMILLGEAYLEAKERIIRDQQLAIRELTTPVLQLHEQLLILPVVGMVDTQRARHLTESLLRAIRTARARSVVMDVSGVPVIDVEVAHHLVQACEAARLSGARMVLTGLSPEIARALVTIDAELSGVRVLGDLQSGIEDAKALLGLRTERTRPMREPFLVPLAL